jgi:hypothetical protein
MDSRLLELAHKLTRSIESIAKSQVRQAEALEKQNHVLESIAKTMAIHSIKTTGVSRGYPAMTLDITIDVPAEVEPNAN